MSQRPDAEGSAAARKHSLIVGDNILSTCGYLLIAVAVVSFIAIVGMKLYSAFKGTADEKFVTSWIQFAQRE